MISTTLHSLIQKGSPCLLHCCNQLQMSMKTLWIRKRLICSTDFHPLIYLIYECMLWKYCTGWSFAKFHLFNGSNQVAGYDDILQNLQLLQSRKIKIITSVQLCRVTILDQLCHWNWIPVLRFITTMRLLNLS